MRAGDEPATPEADKGAIQARSRIALGIGIVLFVVVSVALVGLYARRSADEAAAKQAALALRVEELSQAQGILAGSIAAGASTRTVITTGSPAGAPAASRPPDRPVTLSSAERSSGVKVLVGRFASVGAEAQYGWPATLALGNYLDGDIAFAVASDHGDLFNGAYYVDESTRTVDSRLLLKAVVDVYGWNGASGKERSIAAADLASALAMPGSTQEKWRGEWFWIKVGPDDQVIAAHQIPPP